MERRWFIQKISGSTLLLSLPPLLSNCSKDPTDPIDSSGSTDESTPYNLLTDRRINTLNQSEFELLTDTQEFQLHDYKLNGYSINGVYPSPTIKTSKGQQLKIDFKNRIGNRCIIHWHGLIVPPLMDGHPSLAVSSGEDYNYVFEINQRAGTYFYHSHTHGLTANQVYKGIAGFFIIEDQEEAALNLPKGNYELTLLLQDKRTTSNELIYTPTQMEARMDGYLGNQIFVNGVPNAKHKVEKTVYRLRLLNGSTARILNVSWSNQMDMTLIGTDGGLLETAQHLTHILLAPAERVDILVNFSKVNDSIVKLISAESDLIKTSSGGGMMGSNFTQGTPMDMILFEIQDKEGPNYSHPPQLSVINYPSLESAERIRTITLEMLMQTGHAINGRQYNPQQIEFEVPQGAVEIWKFTNTTVVAHPMHLHGVQFRVISRSNRGVQKWEEGLKDTVLVLPGETVEILVHFTAQPGLYLFHCHNLEHEDAGMMLNYAIV